MNEDANDAVVRGQEASLLDSLLRPYLERAISDINTRFIRAYNDPNTTDTNIFMGLAAELAALENLRQSLTRDQRLGIQAFNKELNRNAG